MTTIKERAPIEYHTTQENLSQHRYVKEWESNRNDINAKINAYITRDYCYNGNQTVKDLFHRYCLKTGIHIPDYEREYYIRRDFSKKINNIIYSDNFLNDPSEDTLNNMYIEFKNSCNNQYIGDENRYQNIMNMINDEKPLYNIYKQLTSEEMDIIGW